jgi:hypothetical protein
MGFYPLTQLHWDSFHWRRHVSYSAISRQQICSRIRARYLSSPPLWLVVEHSREAVRVMIKQPQCSNRRHVSDLRLDTRYRRPITVSVVDHTQTQDISAD